jgi:meso-butanediol dehydrogenase / (S,S)-butanediol dehydrogenase / diacetyl reductase
MSVDGKTVLITGATSGIGAATARAFGAAGARQVISGRDADRGAEIVGEITAAGGDAVFMAADLMDPDACARLVTDAAAHFGKLDVLVNGAGVIFRKTGDATTDDEWRATMAVNVDAVFYTSRAAVGIMKPQGGGSIINVASTASLTGAAGMAAYCASKGAVIQMTRAMAIDHGPDNIRVNAVCPGDVITPMLEGEARAIGMKPEDMYAQSVAGTPLGRIGVPEDISGAILFLASDASSLMSGAGIVLDGGASV